MSVPIDRRAIGYSDKSEPADAGNELRSRVIAAALGPEPAQPDFARRVADSTAEMPRLPGGRYGDPDRLERVDFKGHSTETTRGHRRQLPLADSSPQVRAASVIIQVGNAYLMIVPIDSSNCRKDSCLSIIRTPTTCARSVA